MSNFLLRRTVNTLTRIADCKKRINSGKWGWRVQVENNLSGGPQLKQQWDPETLCGRHGASHHLTIQTVRMRDPHSILYHNLLESKKEHTNKQFSLHWTIKLSIKKYKLKNVWFYATIFLSECYLYTLSINQSVYELCFFTFRHFSLSELYDMNVNKIL